MTCQILAPATEQQAADIVGALVADKKTARIEGGGTRSGFGRPFEADAILSTRALTGITLYEPAELVLSARAGTTLAEIEAAIGANNQMLPFEPMDHRTLYGSVGEPTIGGVAACAASGPRRVQQGAARDHLLGVRLINGRGEIVRSGGRVMKNVTGLDLVKLSCGAHGTLGLLSEVTFKLRPKAQRTGTLVLDDLDDVSAVAALSAGLGSPFEVSGAAHLPAGIARPKACTLLRIENFSDSVDYRLGELAKLLSRFGTTRRLDETESLTLWGDIRDVVPLATPRAEAVWKISVAPTQGPLVVSVLQKALTFWHFYDWGGGLIWLACSADGDAGADAIRAATKQFGGHATLMRARDELRARIDVFEPQAAALMQIARGLKASFDPAGVFNPGKMYA